MRGMAKLSSYNSLNSVPALTDTVPITSGGATRNVPVQNLIRKPYITVGSSGSFSDYICDGVADHTEINSAITAVNSAGGGTVFLRAGTYLISGNINGLSNVILRGEGDATLIKQADSSNIAGSVWNVTSRTNFQIRDLKYDGNKANNATSGRGITLTDSTLCVLDNITIVNTKDHSLNLRSAGTTYCVVNNCRITDSDGSAFIISNGASYNRVINSFAKTIAFTGFYVTGTGTDSTGNSFINCYAESCDYGFDVYASTNCRAENCRSYITVRDNFHVEDSYDINFVSCIGTGSARDAFAVYSSELDSKRATNVTFEACTARGAALNGFHFIGQVISSTTYTAYNMKVIGGSATGNTRYGVQATYITGCLIQGVTIDDNGGSTYEGILIDANCSGVVMANNIISNNGNNPIKLLDSTVDDVKLSNNQYISNGGTNTHNLSTATNITLNGWQLKTPSSATATGIKGDLAWDSSYFYICTATNTWHRVAHAIW
jgi:polygalacturonase